MPLRLVVTSLLVLALPGATPSAPTRIDAGQGTPRDSARRVDVGGRGLVARVRGRGAPTLVLLSGLQMPQENWAPVLPALGAMGTVVTYDRAGVGGSELGARAADGVESARDLHELLRRLDVPRPWVLVAHSHGGTVARLFASRYPTEVAGMVLEEVQHEDVLDGMRAVLRGKDLEAFEQVVAPGFAAPAVPRTEADYRTATRAQVRASGPLPAVPLVVLAVAGRARAMGDLFSATALDALVAKDEAQMRALASSVPGGRLEMVEGSGHLVHADRPDVFLAAVRDVVGRVRPGDRPR